MHDYVIVSYHVDLERKTIELYAQDRSKEKESHFIAKSVLTHSFKNILEFNIVSDVEEWGIDYFMTKHLRTIEAMKQSFWPLDFKNIQQLKEYLVNNNYKFIKISCSYGLQGWVLAKEFEIY